MEHAVLERFIARGAARRDDPRHVVLRLAQASGRVKGDPGCIAVKRVHVAKTGLKVVKIPDRHLQA